MEVMERRRKNTRCEILSAIDVAVHVDNEMMREPDVEKQ